MRAAYYHPKAATDAKSLATHYSAISEQLGDRFWIELLSAIDHARTYPERHHFDATGRRRASLTHFPIHFLFRIFPEEIRITVIRHDRRDPNYGSQRR